MNKLKKKRIIMLLIISIIISVLIVALKIDNISIKEIKSKLNKAKSSSTSGKIDPTQWVAVDDLGRKVGTYGDATVKNDGTNNNKRVGIMYWDWHQEVQNHAGISSSSSKKPYNLSEIISKYPDAKNNYNHSIWQTYNSNYYWWNEPIYGYYTENDNFVLRKQAELLADAGVDFIVFDNTNGAFEWENEYKNIFKVWKKAQDDGVNVPKIVFMLGFTNNSDTQTLIKKLYEHFYNNSEYSQYKSLWYIMPGDTKPLILSYAKLTEDSEENKAINKFFTFRPVEPTYFLRNAQSYSG